MSAGATETGPATAPAVTEETPAVLPLAALAEYETIGDMLAACRPGFDIWPCGRCGTAFSGAPEHVLHADRVLRPLFLLARDAGWAANSYGVWCCPACLLTSEPAPRAPDTGDRDALRAHQDFLAAYDHAAKGLMEKLGGEWRPRHWSFREPAMDGWWRDDQPSAEASAA